MLGWTVDKAVSAFLSDLEARGLSEKVLLVITGDFGRTPTINKRGGRDHWAKLGTLAFAGGGLLSAGRAVFAPYCCCNICLLVATAHHRAVPVNLHAAQRGASAARPAQRARRI